MTGRSGSARVGSLAVAATLAISPTTARGRTQLPEGASAASIECVATVEGRPRVYRIAQEAGKKGQRWVVAMRPADRPETWIRLALSGAAPVFSADAATLSHRSGSGGVIVEMHAGTTSSTLDVYVSYEVEVNLDADLSPAVDELNTDGVVAATCEIRRPRIEEAPRS